MLAKAARLTVVILLALEASAQTVAEPGLDRVFNFTQTEALQSLQEITTVIRSTADIRHAYLDAAQRSLTVRGTAGQIAIVEWLFYELDKPPVGHQGQKAVMREYRVAGGSDDVVRVFYLAHTRAAQDLQEVATLIRSIGDIPRLFTYNAPKAVTLRGTTEQMALAEWLINELDRPAAVTPQSRDSASHEYLLSGGSENVVRLFYLAPAAAPKRFQEIAAAVRSGTGIRRLFAYNALRALALRGTAEQISLADRLIRELNQPAAANAAAPR